MISDFTYYTPTKVIFGKNTESQVGSLVANEGCKKVLVHYGSESAKKSGLLERVTTSLAKQGIDYVTLGGLYHGGEVWDFYDQTRQIQGCYPVGAVLTIAAAGSEMSNSSVITNEDGNLKRGANHDSSRCRFAIMNPEP